MGIQQANALCYLHRFQTQRELSYVVECIEQGAVLFLRTTQHEVEHGSGLGAFHKRIGRPHYLSYLYPYPYPNLPNPTPHFSPLLAERMARRGWQLTGGGVGLRSPRGPIHYALCTKLKHTRPRARGFISLSSNFRKSTPPQSHQHHIFISNLERCVDDFVGELIFQN